MQYYLLASLIIILYYIFTYQKNIVSQEILEESNLLDLRRKYRDLIYLLKHYRQNWEAEKIKEYANRMQLWEDNHQMIIYGNINLPSESIYDKRNFWMVNYLENNYDIIMMECRRNELHQLNGMVGKLNKLLFQAWKLDNGDLGRYQGLVRELSLSNFYFKHPNFPDINQTLLNIPEICNIIGDCKLVIVGPGSHISPQSADHNYKLSILMGLSIPPATTGIYPQSARIIVDSEKYELNNAECVVFHPAYTHQIINPTDKIMVLLWIDIWHPNLPKSQRIDIQRELFPHYNPIYRYMQEHDVSKLMKLKQAYLTLPNGKEQKKLEKILLPYPETAEIKLEDNNLIFGEEENK